MYLHEIQLGMFAVVNVLAVGYFLQEQPFSLFIECQIMIYTEIGILTRFKVYDQVCDQLSIRKRLEIVGDLLYFSAQNLAENLIGNVS